MLSLRHRISKQILVEIARYLAGLAPIVIGVLGPVLMAAVAVLVLPLLYSATLSRSTAVSIVLVQALIFVLPTVVLRKQLLSAPFLAWSRTLPTSLLTDLLGDALAVGVLIAPIGLAYFISSLVWLFQWPQWLRPVWPQAFGAVFISWLLSWALGVVVLHHRRQSEMPRGKPIEQRADTRLQTSWGTARQRGLPVFVTAYYLIRLNFTREKSVLWHACQSAWVVMVIGFLIALCRPVGLPAYALLFSTGLVGWTIWRDRVATKLLSHLRCALICHPVPMRGLQRIAKSWTLLPSIGSTLGVFFIVSFGLQQRPALRLLVYAAIGLVGATILVSRPNASAKERWAVVLIWLAALIVCGDNL